jgi:hypothetical protein
MADRRFAVAVGLAGLLFAVAGYAQPRRIKIRFELDGKPKAGPRNIQFYGEDGRPIADQRISGGSFDAPTLGSSDRVDVHLRFAGRTLIFRGVFGTKFEGTWTVGIDRAPFDEENASSVASVSKPKELWFIKFDPLRGDGTRIVVAGR